MTMAIARPWPAARSTAPWRSASTNQAPTTNAIPAITTARLVGTTVAPPVWSTAVSRVRSCGSTSSTTNSMMIGSESWTLWTHTGTCGILLSPQSK